MSPYWISTYSVIKPKSRELWHLIDILATFLKKQNAHHNVWKIISMQTHQWFKKKISIVKQWVTLAFHTQLLGWATHRCVLYTRLYGCKLLCQLSDSSVVNTCWHLYFQKLFNCVSHGWSYFSFLNIKLMLNSAWIIFLFF